MASRVALGSCASSQPCSLYFVRDCLCRVPGKSHVWKNKPEPPISPLRLLPCPCCSCWKTRLKPNVSKNIRLMSASYHCHQALTSSWHGKTFAATDTSQRLECRLDVSRNSSYSSLRLCARAGSVTFLCLFVWKVGAFLSLRCRAMNRACGSCGCQQTFFMA